MNRSLITTLLSACIVILIGSVMILSLVPPVGRDDLVHHLAVPKLYLKHGGIYEIPSLSFSYYPMNLDLLYMIALYFGHDIAPKLIHFAFGLMTAGLIFYYLRSRLDIRYALIAVILFLSVPIIIKISSNAYVDMGLVFFSTAALLLLLTWREQQFGLKYLILSAIFCGLALGTKYNALIIFFLLTMFACLLCARYVNIFSVIKNGIIYILISLIVFSPWMIRNWHWKKNPIYPLYDSMFNPKPISEIPDAPSQKQHYGVLEFRSILYDESGWEIATLPLRIFFQGEDGNAKYFDGRLNPLLLLLPIAAFIRKEDHETIRKDKNILLLYSVLLFGFTFFSTVLRVRYLTPMIPPLVILSAFGLKNIIENFRNMVKIPMLITAAILLMMNFGYLIGQFEYVKPFEYLSGNISRDDYILRYRPEYKAMQYINADLPDNATILFVFTGKRGYYCDRNYVLDSGEDQNKSFLGVLAERSDNSEDILFQIRKMGLTHILLRADLFSSWMDEQLSPKARNILKEFLSKYATNLFFENGYAVLGIESNV